MTIKELLDDLLIEYDELGMEPTTIVPNPSERAKKWKHELTYALRHLKSELAREIFEEIEKHLFVIAPIEEFDGWARIQLADIMRLKKKYTEGTNETRN